MCMLPSLYVCINYIDIRSFKINKCQLRARSVDTEWTTRTVPSRIVSLIYISFDQQKQFLVRSCRNEQSLKESKPRTYGSKSPSLTNLTTDEAAVSSLCTQFIVNPTSRNIHELQYRLLHA
jgi:hypothetical protein